MSDIQRLEQKIDSQNSSMNEKMDKLIETMTTFVAFQARAEERHANGSDRFDKIEARQDKADDKLSKIWDMVHKNSIVVNGAIGFGCLLVGSVATWLLGGIT